MIKLLIIRYTLPAFFLCICASLFSVSGQTRRDHLTGEEIELLRNVQAIDKRMEIYAKAIDRRLFVINGTSGLSNKELKSLEKDKETWGDLPTGDAQLLITDIKNILDESIDKIDDVADHDKNSALLPIAIHYLADYARELIPRLLALNTENRSAKERAILESSIDYCNDIIEASSKIAKPEKKGSKNKKS